MPSKNTASRPVASRRCYPPEPPGADAMGYVQWHHDHPTPGCYHWVKVHRRHIRTTPHRDTTSAPCKHWIILHQDTREVG